MPFSVHIYKLLDTLEPSLRQILLAILEEIEQQREESVSRNDFIELKNIVADLAKAQKGLAQAQEKTERRLEELAQAQEKTERRLEELAQAQEKTERRLEELAQAQKETEMELRKLIGEHRKTRTELGILQHTVGYFLEDRAYVGLPKLLKRDFEVEVIGHLRREFIEYTPGLYEEVNIIGEGKKDSQRVWIIGECKSQLKKRDIDKFLKTLKKIEKVVSGQKILIAVTYQTSPQVRKYLEEKGIKLYFSYELPLLPLG